MRVYVFSLYLLTTGRFRTHDNKKKHYLYEYLLVMFLFVTTQIRWLFEHSIALEMRTPQYPLLVFGRFRASGMRGLVAAQLGSGGEFLPTTRILAHNKPVSVVRLHVGNEI